MSILIALAYVHSEHVCHGNISVDSIAISDDHLPVFTNFRVDAGDIADPAQDLYDLGGVFGLIANGSTSPDADLLHLISQLRATNPALRPSAVLALRSPWFIQTVAAEPSFALSLNRPEYWTSTAMPKFVDVDVTTELKSMVRRLAINHALSLLFFFQSATSDLRRRICVDWSWSFS